MPYSVHSSEADLIKGCQAQHRLAQKYLYQQYYGKMLGICMRYTRHPEEATDVLNRAFFKVFKSIDQYKPTGSLGGWIARIVYNTSIDYVRSQKKYRSVMDYNTEKDMVTNTDALDQLYAEDLYKIIQKLPDTSRTVFSLYVVEGYKHREIAEILEISINTSKWHLANAKKKLRVLAQNFLSVRNLT